MLILFDYDGVIVDSFDLLLDMCVRVQKDFGCGRNPVCEDFQTIENLDFESLGKWVGIPDAMVSSYSEHVFALQKECWSVNVFPEIPDVFRTLAQNHTLGVITASQTEAVTQTFSDFGLKETIATVLGGDAGKSKAARIDIAREMYAFAPGSTFMVGDAISDIRQGKLAGVRTVAVSWGFQNRELLAKENPDFLIDHPGQLLEIVGDDESRFPRTESAKEGETV